MEFKDRLRMLRRELGLSQTALAKRCDVTLRTIQNYEAGNRAPKNLKIVQKMAAALGTTTEYLLRDDGAAFRNPEAVIPQKDAKEIEELVSRVSGLFAGGALNDDALDGAMRALTDAYWIAKERNKRFAPKKYRETAQDEE